ncbi:MAG: hypothetical protein AB7T49_21575 [Oligoflexales bacterium]
MNISASDKVKASLEGLRPWHNAALSYPENYKMSYEQLLQKIDRDSPSWRENFGASVIAAQEYLGMAAVEKAMIALADENEGKATTYPDGSWRGAEFHEALYGKVSGWNVDKVSAIASGVAKDVVDQVNTSAKLFLGGTTAYIAIAGLLAILVFANSAGKTASVR